MASSPRSVEEHRAAWRRCWPRCPPRTSRWIAGPRPGAGEPTPGGRRAAAVRQLRDGRLRRACRGRRGSDGRRPGGAARGRRHPGRPHGRPRRWSPGTAHRIMTGAPLPAGADAVVPVEQTDGGDDRVRVSPRRRAPGAHVRRDGRGRPGGRRRAGRRARCSGRRRSAWPRPSAAATVPVRRRPRPCSCSPPAPSWSPRARRCNRARSTSRTDRCSPPRSRTPGAVAELLRFVPDDVAQFLGRCASGSTAGDRRSPADLGRRERRRLRGGQGSLHRPGRRVRQGRDAAGRAAGAGRVAELDGVGVVALPGNPVSSQVSFEVFVRPRCGRRSAIRHPHPERPRDRHAGTALTSPPGRRQFRRGVLDAVAGTVREVGGPAVAPARVRSPGPTASSSCPRSVTELPAGARGRGLVAGRLTVQ